MMYTRRKPEKVLIGVLHNTNRPLAQGQIWIVASLNLPAWGEVQTPWGLAFDWAAYIGGIWETWPVRQEDAEERITWEIEQVASWGSKIPEAWARAIFPTIPEGLRYRA